MSYYDHESRQLCCRERQEQLRDEYRRVQRPPKDSHRREHIVVQMRSIWDRLRRQVPQRATA